MFNDVKVEYREETGRAGIMLEWSSYSTLRTVVPSSALFFAEHVAGSPYALAVKAGSADYPYTSAEGTGLAAVVAGEPATFVIQTRDANGNPRAVDEQAEVNDFLNVTLVRHNRQLGQAGPAALGNATADGVLTGYYGAEDQAPSTSGV